MTKKKQISAKEQLANYATQFRRLLGRVTGMQYGNKRDIYEALGYPKDISFEEYFGKYIRQDIAGAIINRPIEATWRGQLSVHNPDDENDTLKNAFDELNEQLGLKKKFIRVDKLTAIGRYGVLLLGFNDVDDDKDFSNEVQKSDNLKLLYVKPHSEYSATVHKLEKDASSERYGLPKFYKIKLGGAKLSTDDSDKSLEKEIVVHHSRVIHITGETLDSEIYGIPVLQKVYNRLMDLEKIVGGSAEMFWRGARPGVQGKLDDDYSADESLLNKLEDQFSEFDHDLRRVLLQEGVTLKTLDQQVSDPKSHKDVQIDMISAATGIPKRILTGSERGELASGQDQDNWHNLIEGRRTEFAEIDIIKPFVKRLMEFGILEEDDYKVEQDPLSVMDEKAKADVADKKSRALKSYSDNATLSALMSFEMFMKHVLGYGEDIITEIMTHQDDIVRDEDEEGRDYERRMREIEEEENNEEE